MRLGARRHIHKGRLLRVTLLLLLGCFFALVPPGSARAESVDFWCKWPTSWQNKTDNLGNDLVRQYVSPDNDAFIEVYAARGPKSDLKELANKLEQAILANGGDYFQDRMGSLNMRAGGNVPAILREYSGMYQGTLLHAFAMYAYGNGGLVTVIGVFPESLADKYWDTVYPCVASLRFTPPPGMAAGMNKGVNGGMGKEMPGTMPAAMGATPPQQPSPLPTAASNGCNEIVGSWKWFTGSTVKILPNGKMPGQGHSWECLDPAQRKYRVVWSNGKWIDDLTLSPDIRRLEGKNQIGNRVWGERIDAPPAPASGKDTAQTGPPPTKNNARRIKGNMGAQWKMAHGSLDTAKPDWNAEWELSTVSGITLHCRDPYKQGKQRYLVRVYDRNGNNLLEETEVGMLAKIRLQAGVYRIKVLPVHGYAGWNCTWE
ncbi:MAG: hypothetical protein ACNI3A_07545 [Desulfovibrio sp.]|uniref:hypothetical protein n=1 Tax=Desulfovibrio sp. 7SRBS1 TaxID=3378064 RepID=UPI003B40A144